MCLQLLKNSDLALRVAPAGLNIIKYFSLRHSRHWPVDGLYPLLLAITSHLTVWAMLLFFKSQTWVLKVVPFEPSCLKFEICPAYLDLKLFSVSPV